MGQFVPSEEAQLGDAFPIGDLLQAVPNLQVHSRDDPKFRELSYIYNRTSSETARPLAIIRPRDETELAAAVKFCDSSKISMTVRGGGHDLQMRCLRSDSVLFDMRELKYTRVVELQGETDLDLGPAIKTQYAVIGAGSRTQDVLETLETQGLTTPSGWCLDVGYVGWACGGGYGLMSSHVGAGADQILGARIVTPSGDVVDTDDDPELLWAIRGAGLGNFGIVAELRVRLYQQSKVLAGFVGFPMQEAHQVFAALEAWSDQILPSRLAAELAIAGASPAAVAILYFHWILDGTDGDAAEAQEWLKKYRGLGTVVMDTVAETTTLAFCQWIDTQVDPAAPHYVESVSLKAFTPEAVDAILAHPPPKGSFIIVHQAHGAMTEPNPNAVFPMRERHFVLCISARHDPLVTDEEEIRQIQTWAHQLNRHIRDGCKLALPHSYWSFAKDGDCDAATFYGEKNVARLRALKKKYNPGNSLPGCYPVL